MPNSGVPRPARSLVSTLAKLKATIPGNNIINGSTEGRKEIPKRINISGLAKTINTIDSIKTIKSVCLLALDVSWFACVSPIAETLGNNTVPIEPGIIQSLSAIPTAIV